MERRDFLKKVGIGTLGLAALPILPGVAYADDDDEDDGRRKFYFQALSHVGDLPLPQSADAIVMSGFGTFRGSHVTGGGEFVHFDGTKIPSLDFKGTGRWKATRLISFTEVGTWGVGVSGILTLGAKLLPCDGPQIRGATVRIVCNIGPAGLGTPGTVEGFTLTLPDGTTFKPFEPNLGLTLFTRRCDEHDDD
jgi:hypothetical protein